VFRGIFFLASLLSLLLCLATVVLWVRSYWRADYLYFTKERVRIDGQFRTLHADWAIGLLLMNGTVQFDRQKDVRRDHVLNVRRDGALIEGIHSATSGPWDWGEIDIAGDTREFVDNVGFAAPTERWWLFAWNEGPRPFTGPYSRTGPPDGVSRAFFFPLWLVTCVLIVLPCLKLILLFIRIRRRHTHCCPACGYSLTGNTSGTCPECGSPILQASRTA